jgi:tRNA-splicing ligase RtcB
MKREAYIVCPREIPLEPDAVQQLRDAASLDDALVAIAMPDIHVGYGVPIGSVVATRQTVIPAAVGFDVNCGMRLMTTRLSASEVDAPALARDIQRRIPLGEGKDNLHGGKEQLARMLRQGLSGLSEGDFEKWDLGKTWDADRYRRDLARVEDLGSLEGDPRGLSVRAVERGRTQLASLGGGNHFIEMQVVTDVFDKDTALAFGIWPGQFVVMIHSGSRGLGHQVGDDYMHLAAQFDARRGLPFPNRELAYLPTLASEGRDYLGAMRAAANFAFVNRYLMGLIVEEIIRERYPDAAVALVYDQAHNNAKFERHRLGEVLVHRKGACRAFGPRRMGGGLYAATGQPVLIPGSMGTASYVLAGVDGNDFTLASVNHGAGRTMSRRAASGKTRSGKRVVREAAITDDEFERSMKGIHLICEDERTIKEEAPQAYKNIDAVVRTVVEAGLAKLVAKMRPLAVLKG